MYLPRQIEVSDLSPMKVPKSFHYHLALKSIMRTLCQYVQKFFSKKNKINEFNFTILVRYRNEA